MFGRLAYAACVIGMATTSAAQAQEACWHPHEVEAARVRDFQTMLMVGTLQCSASDQTIIERYNRFVANNRQMLASQNTVLKTHFLRTSGIREGARAYDSFTTRLANSHSGSARTTEASFCQTVGTMAELAGTAPAADIGMMAKALAERPAGVGETCEAVQPGTAQGPAVAALAPPTGQAETVGAGAGPVPPVDVANAGAPVGEVVPANSGESKVAAVAAPAAQPASPDQLQAAASALQAAAVALEAAVAARTQAAAQPGSAEVAESPSDQVSTATVP